MLVSIIAQGLFLGLASTAVIRRWSNGGSASGTTDPDVASGCTYWANDIASGDTCDSLQTYFGITVEQLVSWVRPSYIPVDALFADHHDRIPRYPALIAV